jgi:ATP-dependent RNA helicase DDX19/DBP5
MLLFSATYEEKVMEFAESIIPDPIIIRLRRDEETLENIRQFYVVCIGMEQKFESLINIYGVISIGQCIIFCKVSALFPFFGEQHIDSNIDHIDNLGYHICQINLVG